MKKNILGIFILTLVLLEHVWEKIKVEPINVVISNGKV